MYNPGNDGGLLRTYGDTWEKKGKRVTTAMAILPVVVGRFTICFSFIVNSRRMVPANVNVVTMLVLFVCFNNPEVTGCRKEVLHIFLGHSGFLYYVSRATLKHLS